MLPYRLILIFAFIIIRNIRKTKFSFKVLPRFFKSGQEFEDNVLKVLTKQYYFVCGRRPYLQTLIFASIIIRNIRKTKFSFKVLSNFFKSWQEFEDNVLKVLTKQYYFICGRRPYLQTLIFAFIIIRTLGKRSFPLKFCPAFSKAGRSLRTTSSRS